MPANKLREFLDKHHVKYVNISHSPAYTAQEIAASAHIPGKDLAKTVIVRLDDRLAMVVVQASRQVDFDRLKAETGANTAELAAEADFEDKFPDCEAGAMPPFGNLYGMDVYVANDLAEDEEIAFNAGSHTRLFKLPYEDYNRLVEPKVIYF